MTDIDVDVYVLYAAMPWTNVLYAELTLLNGFNSLRNNVTPQHSASSTIEFISINQFIVCQPLYFPYKE